MTLEYPLPGDTLRVVQCLDLSQCRNPGLLFNRFVPNLQVEREARRRKALESVQKAKPDEELLKGLHRRWRALVAAFQSETFEATTEWRLVVGLGQKGPLEVGFSFHRLYGIPIIPGSALKGLARAYAYLVEDRDESNADFCAVFGRAPGPGEEQNQAAAGKAVFFDAIPLSSPCLDLDVMNPHYPKYYQGKEPPTNWQDPVPVYFLALQPKSRFAFAVGWRDPVDSEGQRLRALAVQWLKAGLQELGIGAKTSAGYGYFSIHEPRRASLPAQEVLLPAEEPEPIVWCLGVVKEYRPDKGIGRLTNVETGEELTFHREAIEEKGWSPGRKQKVQYALAEREGRRQIVKVRRKE
ncbi:MAG: type III-B CRISPR module RAMP protein Cmr6 [Anaerolineae bacterium]|nr:type III-B CRISPR module RAMP protein Cmr6 [Anaerolineae bacterium]MDW8068806.1 type III-B CRISPR module RAMP protein Cmr6 [Anaerolineae bacterium]